MDLVEKRCVEDAPALERRERSRARLADELDAIARHCAAQPLRDARSAEDIIGYDERGVPG